MLRLFVALELPEETRAHLSALARRFLPHVTLARLRSVPPDQVAPFVAAHGAFRDGPFTVPSFVLMSSRLGTSGSVYTAERNYPLLGGNFGDLAAEWSDDQAP